MAGSAPTVFSIQGAFLSRVEAISAALEAMLEGKVGKELALFLEPYAFSLYS